MDRLALAPLQNAQFGSGTQQLPQPICSVVLFGTERVFPAQFDLLQADSAVDLEGHHIGKPSH